MLGQHHAVQLPRLPRLDDSSFTHLFGIINLLLAIPVVFYSASDYFILVWAGLKKGIITIDLPILLGILVAFFSGTNEVLVLDGAGYFDSLTGLIFFLLCGKWFQQRIHEFLSFERDYKSYFPLAVTLVGRKEQGVQGMAGMATEPSPQTALPPPSHLDEVIPVTLLLISRGLANYKLPIRPADVIPLCHGLLPAN